MDEVPQPLQGGLNQATVQKACNTDGSIGSGLPVPSNVSKAQKLPAGDRCTTSSISCNTSLQLLQASVNSLINSSSPEQIIHIKNASFAAQIFVFQEPDPPRFA